MKKFYFILLTALIFAGCSGDSDENPTSSCGGISTFNLVQQTETLRFTYTGNTDVSYYEISYFETGNAYAPDNGNKFNTTNPNELSKKINELSVNFNANYSFFIRTVCSSGETSDWKGPVILSIEPYCDGPRDLRVDGFLDSTFMWASSYTNESSYYEVQYGLEGFQLGQGTTLTTNYTQTAAMVLQKNKVYDFYVRSKCAGNLGWSSWSGPVSRVSPIDQNICSAPISAAGNIESYSGSYTYVRMVWQTNGNMNSDFEFVIVNKGLGPETGTARLFNPYLGWPVTSIPTYGQYDFYVRTVCANGSKTAWFGPTPLDY